jgi:cyclohexadieny/prephenate dehydrogenase
MTKSTAEAPPFEAIGIVGCGLIGCSIAAALKQRNFGGRVVGCGRAGANLEMAVARGYVDAVENDLAKAAAVCGLLVVCTPVDQIANDVLAAAIGCRPGTVITDAGSVKQSVCGEIAHKLPPGVTFIGSHPIAGSEKRGCAHARPDLFVDHVCVLTPEAGTPPEAIGRLAGFWESIGMRVVAMSAELHDRALAQTSHVPHVVAAALASLLADENRRFTAGGFHDTTRIAAGDPGLWTAILLANAKETAAALRAVGERLNEFLQVIESRDKQSLTALLRLAKQNRDAIAAGILPSDATGFE